MVAATEDFASWIEQADIPSSRLTPEVEALLGAVFRFRQRQGTDYYSTRLLSHFLLHCDCGLKVAQIARLLGLGRPTASGQQGLSSKQVIQQAQHRLRGRPYGKLLPRFAGPIAGFLLGHPQASRAELLDFIEATFAVRVSRIASYKFMKKFGLDHLSGPEPPPTQMPQGIPAAPLPLPPAPASTAPPRSPGSSPAPLAAQAALPQRPESAAATAPADLSGSILLPLPSRVLTPQPAPPFCSGGPSTPAPSC